MIEALNGPCGPGSWRRTTADGGQYMDAVQLIMASRGALARGCDAATVMAEAWQAQALAQAIGSRLAVGGPPELRGEALALSEVSGRGCGVLAAASPGIEAIRAARLTEVGDPRSALVGLGGLLGEVGIALVGVSCTAGAEAHYWNCVEAIDAADESCDRIVEMLRRLAVREARGDGGDHGIGDERDGLSVPDGPEPRHEYAEDLPAPDPTAGPP